ncbi:hypothetical protein [Arthrobacter sp. S41]|uniref:hypothetical protein n=1 Tax=Arthrobacter sp. S41 TaxID=2509721 RepID=UPI0013EFC0AD|nr:hypothetical protein [Arthrobacter sp. S41]
MNKTLVSPVIAWVVSALLLLIGIWQLTTDGQWRGLAFIVLAVVWAIVALRQAQKRKSK